MIRHAETELKSADKPNCGKDWRVAHHDEVTIWGVKPISTVEQRQATAKRLRECRIPANQGEIGRNTETAEKNKPGNDRASTPSEASTIVDRGGFYELSS